jgi:uncharacterized membrane protein HdeD (DUF308 family)
MSQMPACPTGHDAAVMASDDLPGRLVLGLRALLAVLFGLTGFSMVVLAVFLPRATTVLIVEFFAGYALLDGLLCIAAAARAMRRPLPRSLVALEGLVEVGTAIAAFVLIRGLGQRRPGILVLIAAWALAIGVLQMAWTFAVDIHRGRLLLAILAALSVAFGLFLLASPPPDLLTAIWRLAVYVLFVGVLRIVLTFRLQGPLLPVP